MKLKLKINGIFHGVKLPDNLTVAEYKAVAENPNAIGYLSAVTGQGYKDITEKAANGTVFYLLSEFINQLKPIDSFLKDPKPVNFVYNDKCYGLQQIRPDKYGYVQNFGQFIAENDNIIDWLTFSLATVLAKKANYEEAIEIYEDLQGYNYLAVFTSAAFFLRIYLKILKLRPKRLRITQRYLMFLKARLHDKTEKLRALLRR